MSALELPLTWLASQQIASLAPAELGGLVNLLASAAANEGRLPAEENSLAALSRLGSAWFRRARGALLTAGQRIKALVLARGVALVPPVDVSRGNVPSWTENKPDPPGSSGTDDAVSTGTQTVLPFEEFSSGSCGNVENSRHRDPYTRACGSDQIRSLISESDQIKDQIRARVPVENFELAIGADCRLEGAWFVVEVESEKVAAWLESRYAAEVDRALEAIRPGMRVRYSPRVARKPAQVDPGSSIGPSGGESGPVPGHAPVDPVKAVEGWIWDYGRRMGLAGMPPVGLSVKVLAAARGAPLADVHAWLSDRFRRGYRPRKWAWFLTVIQTHFSEEMRA